MVFHGFEWIPGSDALFDRPKAVASYSFGAPAVYKTPFVVPQGVQSIQKLSTVQLGNLQPAWRLLIKEASARFGGLDAFGMAPRS